MNRTVNHWYNRLFLFQTKLIAHKTVWNFWCFLLSGRRRRYAKNVTYDTMFLNEAILCEAVLQSAPLLIVRWTNLLLIPYNLSNAYSTPVISAVSAGLGLVRYGIVAWWLQYAYGEAPFFFKLKLNDELIRFGFKREPLDIKANQEIRESYLEYWTRSHNECKADLLYLGTYKILSTVFSRQDDADNSSILKRMREPSLLALREKDLRDISSLELATETMHLMLKDTFDSKLCTYLKSVDVREPIDLVDITENTITAICKRINHYKVKDIVRANLNLLVLQSAKARDALYIQDGESKSKHITDKFGTHAYRQLLFPLLKTNGQLDICVGAGDDGLYATELSVDSLAYKDGVRSGDRILFINDKAVKTFVSYNANIEITNKKSRTDRSRNQVRLVIARENPSYTKEGGNADELLKSFSSASYNWLKRHRRTLLPFGSSKVGVCDVMQMDDKSLLQMFRKIDIDGSGTIEEKELQSFLEELHIGGAKTAKTMMELVDVDHDNEITPEEFIKMMKIVQGKADQTAPDSTSIKIYDASEDSSLPGDTTTSETIACPASDGFYSTHSIENDSAPSASFKAEIPIETNVYKVETTAYPASDGFKLTRSTESDSMPSTSLKSETPIEPYKRKVETTACPASGGKYAVSEGDDTAIDIYNTSVDVEIKLKPKAT